MKAPPISETIIFSDDAKLAAQISCVLAKPRFYLPVCDGPRVLRPDADAEVIRRHNAAVRAKSKIALMAGPSNDAFEALRALLERRISCPKISSYEDIATIPASVLRTKSQVITWGCDRIGIGLLKALRSNSQLLFEQKPSPSFESVPSKSGHLVVCQQGEEISEVIAANYAYALGAGLVCIPNVAKELCDSILERFYSLYDSNSGVAPRQAQEELKQQLLELCGPIPIPSNGSITFIGDLPFGFAFSDVPSTHLFKYPDLGVAVVNGFAAEQPETHGTGVVVLVDPSTTPAPEIQASVDLLKPRGAFIRGYEGQGANVRAVSEMLENFPYDLLIFATHCGDSSGFRWTYEFTDSESLPRCLVVDIAVGWARTDDPDILDVTEFNRFVSLDGVDWNDPRAKKNLYVGSAINDFIERKRSVPKEFAPVKKETVERVVGSSAMKMSDGNFIAMPRSLADEGVPIIINNACLSWHRLASTFTFSNARGYVGTLFPVTSTEASDVVVGALGKHWRKPLAVAFWASQRDVYGSGGRRPYVVNGVFPQRLRVKQLDYPAQIEGRLRRALTNWRKKLDTYDRKDTHGWRKVNKIIENYQRELKHFIETYRPRA